jgi:ADP-heptose:LPS heptosyltransferase
LLLRPDHIGDVLLGASAVALLRTSLPAAQFTYLVGPWSADAAMHGPAVHAVRTLPFPGFTRQPKAHPLQPYGLLVREALKLRAEHYDLAVVLRTDHWWGGLLALLAGIPLRIGGDTPELRPLLTHAYTVTPGQPAPERSLAIARLALQSIGVGAIEVGDVRQFTVGEAARVAASALWREHQLDRVVAIHARAGAPLKSWPASRWAELADALSERAIQVVLTGAPNDAPQLETIAARMRHCVPRLCGQSIEVSAAVYERCALVVTVDSGAGHLAAAVGTPTVRLYGPAPASVFGPWPPRKHQRVIATDRLACAPCGFLESPPCGARASPACMLALGVSDVLNAIEVELGQS